MTGQEEVIHEGHQGTRRVEKELPCKTTLPMQRIRSAFEIATSPLFVSLGVLRG